MKEQDTYKYPLRIDLKLEKPLKVMSEKTRLSINDIINIALEVHLKNHQVVHKIKIK